MSWDYVGRIFNIQRYSIHDGPGIRTLIFLKGCTLRCKWCANPESQSYNKEILHFKNKCINCMRCYASCSEKAIIINGEVKLNRDKCIGCSKCVDSCYFNARDISGKDISVNSLFNEVIKDKDYFISTEGGVTFSGGEPFMQKDFLKACLKKFKSEGISTSVETSGNIPFENIKESLKYIDILFFDIKHIDPIKHREFTGCDNKLILENIKKISEIHKNIVIRIPFIPNFNNEETVEEIIEFISCFKNISAVEVLPFHRLGEHKYSALNREYEFSNINSISKSHISYIEDIGEKCNCLVRVGTV